MYEDNGILAKVLGQTSPTLCRAARKRLLNYGAMQPLIRRAKEGTVSDNTITPVTLIVTYAFALAVLAGLAQIAYDGDAIFVALSAFGGAFAGMLGAALDHSILSVKPAALTKMTGAQKAYMALRISMATALGMAAAFIAQGVLAPKMVPDSTYWIIAFVGAYVFDVSRLSPAK